MRVGVLCLGLLAAVAAYGQRGSRDDDTAATKRACGVADCFLERDIRDFEVIDQTHLIVYVGAQRCAFHVELSGTLCDMSFAPEVHFRRQNELPDGRPRALGDGPLSRSGGDPFDPICASARTISAFRCTAGDSQSRRRRRVRRIASGTPPSPRSAASRTSARLPTISSSSSTWHVESCRRCRRWGPARSRSARRKRAPRTSGAGPPLGGPQRPTQRLLSY
jgi:hypothetical protein